MNNLQFMQKYYSYEHLLRYPGCLILIKTIIILHHLEQVLTIDEFRDDIDVGLGLDTLFVFE